ncbi:MAG: hypothetical protein IJ575_10765 [Selenomonadaceae bacterium]|nr:hypothetical protein [Selenomonadaceae bacterium]
MLKKFLAMLVLGFAMLFNGNAEARDVYVGTSNVTGRDCYVMTETIVNRTGARRNIDVTLKMVRQSDGNVQYLDYTFIEQGSVYFRNSQGFSGTIDRYETPIEWEMYQVIR